MKSADYKKASALYLIGNIFNKGIAFLTVPIFTRILSPSDYGMVTTFNSWCGIVSMVLGFALHMAIRAAFVDYKNQVDKYLTSALLFTIACSTGVIVVVCTFVLLFKISFSILLILLCLIQAMSTAIIEDYSYYLMMKFKYKYRAIFMILPNLLSVVISILTITLICKSNLYMGRIVPTAIITLGFGACVVFAAIRKSGFVFRRDFIKHGLKISVPLILHGIALIILSQSDRIMITWLADASQTGIYSLIYNFSMIATVITTALDGVWVPWFTNKMKTKSSGEINKLAADYVNLMTYAMCCLIMVAPEIVKLLASAPYWEGIVIIPPIVLANYVIFIYTLYINVEHFYKKTARISVFTAVAAVLNIALNYIFIPRFGYMAAAFTTIGSYLVSLVLHASYSKKLERDIFPTKLFYRPLVHVFVFSVLFYVLIDNLIIRWLIMLAYFMLMLLRERKRIVQFFPGLGKRFE